MKKTVCLMLSLVMLVQIAGCALGEETVMDYDGVETPKEEAQWYSVSYPLYIYDEETKYSMEMPLFFFDGVEDLPWIDLEEAADILNTVETSLLKTTGYHLAYERKDRVITLERETR